jgi:hypothetical protein
MVAKWIEDFSVRAESMDIMDVAVPHSSSYRADKRHPARRGLADGFAHVAFTKSNRRGNAFRRCCWVAKRARARHRGGEAPAGR